MPRSSRVDWQADDEPGTPIGRKLGRDLSAVLLDDGAADVQTKAQPNVAGEMLSGVWLIKAVEQRRAAVRRNAGTMVADHHLRQRWFWCGDVDLDTGSTGAVDRGVLEKVHEYLLDTQRIHSDPHGRGCEHVHWMLRTGRLERLRRHSCERREIGIRKLEVQRASFESGEVNRLTDEARQARGLMLHHPEQLPQSFGWQCSETIELAEQQL